MFDNDKSDSRYGWMNIISYIADLLRAYQPRQEQTPRTPINKPINKAATSPPSKAETEGTHRNNIKENDKKHCNVMVDIFNKLS